MFSTTFILFELNCILIYCIWNWIIILYSYFGFPLFSFETFEVQDVFFNFCCFVGQKRFFMTVEGNAPWWSCAQLSYFNCISSNFLLAFSYLCFQFILYHFVIVYFKRRFLEGIFKEIILRIFKNLIFNYFFIFALFNFWYYIFYKNISALKCKCYCSYVRLLWAFDVV